MFDKVKTENREPKAAVKQNYFSCFFIGDTSRFFGRGWVK
jgi:hypothetical protein